jgi:hypothetical protein
VGDTYNIDNTAFELVCTNQSGDRNCILFDDEEGQITESIGQLTANPPALSRIVRGGTDPEAQPVDVTVAM